MTAPGVTDRGSATAIAASIALVLVTAATVVVLVVAVILASHRAWAAADLAALAAATAEVGGSDVCPAARVSARMNGADLTSCVLNGTTSSFVVAVTVSVRTGLSSPLPTHASAAAHAGNAVG